VLLFAHQTNIVDFQCVNRFNDCRAVNTGLVDFMNSSHVCHRAMLQSVSHRSPAAVYCENGITFWVPDLWIWEAQARHPTELRANRCVSLWYISCVEMCSWLF